MTTTGLSIQVPYLPTTQSFPTENPKDLQSTLSKRDTDIAHSEFGKMSADEQFLVMQKLKEQIKSEILAEIR